MPRAQPIPGPRLIVDNSIPCVGLEAQSRGKMWADERDIGDQLIFYWRHLKEEEGSPPPWSSQDHLWEHLVLLEKILEQDLVQIMLLCFSLPTDVSCDVPQAGQSWQKNLLFISWYLECLHPAPPPRQGSIFSQDHSDLLQALKFPVKDLPQVLESQ